MLLLLPDEKNIAHCSLYSMCYMDGRIGAHLLSLSEMSQVCAPGCGVPNICDGMGHSNEYAEFERRTIIGYRHCNSFFSPTYSTVNCKMCFCKV